MIQKVIHTINPDLSDNSENAIKIPLDDYYRIMDSWYCRENGMINARSMNDLFSRWSSHNSEITKKAKP